MRVRSLFLSFIFSLPYVLSISNTTNILKLSISNIYEEQNPTIPVRDLNDRWHRRYRYIMPRIPPFKEIIARSPLVFIIGVAGDSGSGKTTFTNAIRQIFGPDLVATITLDDYHKYDREERKRLDITPLHPDANNLTQLEVDVARLKEGYAITKPVYNHATGIFDPPVPFASKKNHHP